MSVVERGHFVATRTRLTSDDIGRSWLLESNQRALREDGAFGKEAGVRAVQKLWILVVCLALLVAACGDDAGTGTTEQSSPSEPTTTAAPITTTEPTSDNDGTDFEVVDGVLQPLADGFPDDAITIWNPFSAGSHNDVFNQFLAEVGQKYSPVPLSAATQESGAALHYALIDFLADQPRSDEGYHIFGVSWSGMALKRLTLEDLADTPFTVLKPINNMMSSPFVLATQMDSDYASIEDVIAAAQATPGGLTLGVESAGGNTHMTGAIFVQQAGVDMIVLPTGGSAENLALLEGGGADLAAMGFQLGIEDRFRILLVTGDERQTTLPDVPAASELGWEIPIFSSFGVGTMESVSDEHTAWLTELFRLVYEDPEFWSHYESWDNAYMEPADVNSFMEGLTESLEPVVP